MQRREKLFWLVAGFLLILGVISLIPTHYEICKEGAKTGEEACPSYRFAPFLVIQIGKALDALSVAITALATIAIAWFTWSLRRSTDRLWDAGERQLKLLAETSAAQSRDMQHSIKAAIDSAKAANRSAKVAEEALVATDRAWISIKAKVTQPLIFKGDKITIGVDFEMVNVGNSPATHAQLFTELCRDIIQARRKGEEAARLSSSSMLNMGVVLFPKETREEETRDLGTSLSDFKATISAMNTEENPCDAAWPAIMACVTYRLAGSSDIRHTVILFEVTHRDPVHPGWDGSESETDPYFLRLIQTFMSGQVT
ncbi:hypothetical protein [Bradyrhizobium erythrophlei]|uniref:Uncharacterized protein n=1 Tax=Bradyrhizobium erythrophlei TaxID=1437360 RepID=A0A1M5PHD2_9BRAD|nr:hypothetical protein [Bradyrhizobium erythrophlei]SHH01182.1 hypothetical protein SAMN05443248_3366 [Bradyrhizobium erythrophlei]